MRLRDLTPEQVAELTCVECRKPKRSTIPIFRDGKRRRLCARHASAVLLTTKELATADRIRRACPWLGAPRRAVEAAARAAVLVDQRELF